MLHMKSELQYSLQHLLNVKSVEIKSLVEKNFALIVEKKWP